MWLSDFQTVLPDMVLPRGSVRVEDGYVADIADRPMPGAAIEGGGMMLLPGLVDLHGDMIEREIEPRPGAAFPVDMAVMELDKRLACSGVTTAFVAVTFSDAATFGRVRSEARAREIIETIVHLKDSALTDLRVHARFEVNNERAAPVLCELIDGNAVDLVSLTDHTPGQGQYRDIERYVRYIARSRGLDEAEVAARTNHRLQQRAERPQTWDIVRDVTQLAAEKGLPIASHDDDCVEKVALMQELGATISEFPVTLEAAQEARRRGLVAVMGAPNALRGTSNSGNLGAREALGADALDALASDYHPAAMLRAAIALAEAELAPLHRAVDLITGAPARAIGLEDRGAITVGRRADMIMADRRPVPRIRATLCRGQFSHAEIGGARSLPVSLLYRDGRIHTPGPALHSVEADLHSSIGLADTGYHRDTPAIAGSAFSNGISD